MLVGTSRDGSQCFWHSYLHWQTSFNEEGRPDLCSSATSPSLQDHIQRAETPASPISIFRSYLDVHASSPDSGGMRVSQFDLHSPVISSICTTAQGAIDLSDPCAEGPQAAVAFSDCLVASSQRWSFVRLVFLSAPRRHLRDRDSHALARSIASSC